MVRRQFRVKRAKRARGSKMSARREGPCGCPPGFAERDLWNIAQGRSLRFDVGSPDHLGPLLDVVGDELAEVGRRTLKDRRAQGGKSRLDLGISEGGIDFLVELVDDLGRRVLGNADTLLAAGLVVRHKFAQGWNVR